MQATTHNREPLRQPGEQRAPERIKIGAVARHFHISVDLLRLYEREGLVIPLKSSAGTRYFTERDFLWIETVLRLVREAGLNFAGIRHLLALLPCWTMRECGYSGKNDCPVVHDCSTPCWTNQQGCGTRSDCYFCPVYRAAPSCDNLKGLLVMAETRSAVAAQGAVHVA